jgi:hypothetical protein
VCSRFTDVSMFHCITFDDTLMSPVRTGNTYLPVIVDDDEQLIRAGGLAGISARIQPTQGSIMFSVAK